MSDRSTSELRPAPHDGAVAKSSTNVLVGTGFASCCLLQFRTDFKGLVVCLFVVVFLKF